MMQAASRHASYAGIVANCEWLRRNVFTAAAAAAAFKHLEGSLSRFSKPPDPQSDSHSHSSLKFRARYRLRNELTELVLGSNC